jgi:hypothetical protein
MLIGRVIVSIRGYIEECRRVEKIGEERDKNTTGLVSKGVVIAIYLPEKLPPFLIS